MKLRSKCFSPTWRIFVFSVKNVLFLKKVHSWEGVTEMVLGLFLLVL